LINLNELVLNCASTLEPVYIELLAGWNTIGYTLRDSQDVVETLAPIVDSIKIIKNNAGEFYWPEMGTFNQIGSFVPGQGYLLKMNETITEYYFPILGED
jgi:hypothetical protein